MLDQEPQGYKFKHSKRISLDKYRGVGNGVIQLNDMVADGFMRVSDMRHDIVIVQKPQDRVRDYEEVGFVRVAKFLKMPRMEFWHGDGMVEIRKEDDTWLIAINDQELADRVVRTNDGSKKFDDIYAGAFSQEVSRGLTSCLKREKLLNDGKYHLGFLSSYEGLIVFDLFIIPAITATRIANGDNPLDITLRTAEMYTAVNCAYNVLNLVGSGLRAVRDKINKIDIPGYEFPLPRFNEPFVRHSLAEVIAAPVVPLDRLFRGWHYLNQHGKELLTSCKA